MAQKGIYEIDATDIENLKDNLAIFPREAKRAMVESMNRTVSKIITYTQDEVRGEYPSIKRSDIKNISKIKKATFADTNAEVTYTGQRLKASAFPHTISRSKKRSPVTLKIKKTPIKSGSNPVMFGERVGGSRGAKGKREVYKRESGSTNVETVYTVSIPQMVSNESVYERIQKQASEHYVKTFQHQFDYRIGRIKGAE